MDKQMLIERLQKRLEKRNETDPWSHGAILPRYPDGGVEFRESQFLALPLLQSYEDAYLVVSRFFDSVLAPLLADRGLLAAKPWGPCSPLGVLRSSEELKKRTPSLPYRLPVVILVPEGDSGEKGRIFRWADDLFKSFPAAAPLYHHFLRSFDGELLLDLANAWACQEDHPVRELELIKKVAAQLADDMASARDIPSFTADWMAIRAALQSDQPVKELVDALIGFLFLRRDQDAGIEKLLKCWSGGHNNAITTHDCMCNISWIDLAEARRVDDLPADFLDADDQETREWAWTLRKAAMLWRRRNP